MPMTGKELGRLETSMKRSRPFGDEAWTAKVVKKLGLEHTVRDEGRPKRKAILGVEGMKGVAGDG
jgi:hypothetical protein